MTKFKELLRGHEYGPLGQGQKKAAVPYQTTIPGISPEVKHRKQYASQIEPQVHQEYLKIKTVVLASTVAERPVQSCMVIGSVPGEGATTVAVTLAHVMATGDAFPTLLVDSDIRHPSVHTYLGLPNDVGLGELLSSDMPFEQALQEGPVPDLRIITAGNVLLDTSNILKTNRFHEFMSYAKKRFKYIIFDASPVSEGFDGIVFGAALDGCLLVIHTDRTPVSVVASVQQSLAQAKIHLLGVVLNRKKRYVPSFILKDYGAPAV